MRDSARVAARVDNWLTNGDAPTHARLIRGVTNAATFGRHSQHRLSPRRCVNKKATKRLIQALRLPLALSYGESGRGRGCWINLTERHVEALKGEIFNILDIDLDESLTQGEIT